MIHIRNASAADARALSELLNAIISTGGTTAMTEPVSRADMARWIVSNPAESALFLAENAKGKALGFQSIEPLDKLPREACDIATFSAQGHTQLGVGSALFEATRTQAAKLGYHWINAAILHENAGGLAYYQSRGFERYGSSETQVLMRYTLR